MVVLVQFSNRLAQKSPYYLILAGLQLITKQGKVAALFFIITRIF